MNRLLSATLAAVLAASAVGAGTVAASAEPWHHGGGWHHRGGWDHGGGWYGGRGWNRGWHGGGWHHHDNGAAVAAGIGGLALGAIVGSALASPNYYDEPPVYYQHPVPVERVYPVRRAYRVEPRSVYYGNHATVCAEHYRSYDPRTDTFLGYDGYRHRCNL